MNLKIRNTQLKILKIFSKHTKNFALSGGTALELYYLKHRFSRDLDFFSPKYDLKEIKDLILAFSKGIGKPIKLENEFMANNRARVQFYVVPVKNSPFPLKIDFIEDVFFNKPTIKKPEGIPVYDVKHIYFQKIVAVTGTQLIENDTGRKITTGRREVRDTVDIYFLSQKIKPLHRFLKTLSGEQRRGMVQWYRSFSRQEFKLGFLDLDLYDKKLDASQVIIYLEDEIKKFISEAVK